MLGALNEHRDRTIVPRVLVQDTFHQNPVKLHYEFFRRWLLEFDCLVKPIQGVIRIDDFKMVSKWFPVNCDAIFQYSLRLS